MPVPQVPRTVSVLEASPPQFKQVCDTVTEYKQECRTIMISTTVNVPTKRCETVNGKKCVNYKVPDVQVVSIWLGFCLILNPFNIREKVEAAEKKTINPQDAA